MSQLQLKNPLKSATAHTSTLTLLHSKTIIMYLSSHSLLKTIASTILTQKMMEDQDYFTSFLGEQKMLSWFPKLVETQVDLIATTIASLFRTSLTQTTSFTPPKATAAVHHPTTPAAPTRPSAELAAATQQLVKRVGHGVLGAVYAGMVLSLVMVVAAVAGVVLVNQWVEQPVFVKQRLHFDYTQVNPEALVVFDGAIVGVPVGHTFYVSVSLLVSDSNYNRDVGVFQLMAEVISTNGQVIARSSQPSMLLFQSQLIRLLRTFAIGLPLMLGLARETQKITVPMLNYKEDRHMRTGAVKITLMPRAGTLYLPQLYEAEILMQSKLPRLKEFIYNWKWTFYVWTTCYMYILLLLPLVYFFKPLIVYPVSRAPALGDRSRLDTVEEKRDSILPEEREFTESLRKWQQYRKKRKAELLSISRSRYPDEYTTPASSYTLSKDDIAPYIEEDVGDSESICKGD